MRKLQVATIRQNIKKQKTTTDMAKINVKDTDVSILKINDADYISITDIAKYKTDDTSAVIANWMRNRNTIEFLGIWETLYNPNFKPLEFEGFRKRQD